MTILLTAANGRTGRAVLTALAAKGARVKVFIRNEGQWPDLESLGAIDYAVGNMQEKQTVDEAVKGCDGIVHIGPPMHPDELEITGRFISAALHHRVERFIYYSVMHPLLRDIRHHRLKLDAEQHLVESGLAYSIVQPSRYMQHLENIWKQILETGVHAMPFSVEQRFSVVDLVDLAEATALVATQPGHLYACYELAGPQDLSQQDMAGIIGRQLQRQVRAEAMSLQQMEQGARARGAGDDRVEQMIAMNAHYDKHGFRGNPNVLCWLLGRPPAKFEDYVGRLVASGKQ